MYAHSEVRRAQTFDTRNQDFGHRAQGPPAHRVPAQTFHPQQHHPQQHHPQQHHPQKNQMSGGFPAHYNESHWQRRPASGRQEEIGVQSHLARMPAHHNDSQWQQHQTTIDSHGRRVYSEPAPMPQSAPAPQPRVLPLGSHHDSSGRLGSALGGRHHPQPAPVFTPHSAPARPTRTAPAHHPPQQQAQAPAPAPAPHHIPQEFRNQAFPPRQVSSFSCCGSKDKAIDHVEHRNEFRNAR